MPTCKKCHNKFPNRITLDNGQQRTLHTRAYCLTCSPIGSRKMCGPVPQEGERGVSQRFATRTHTCKICGRKFANKTRILTCTTCKSRYRRITVKQELKAKAGNKCAICGYDKCTDALDFHHVNKEEKHFNLSANYSLRSKEDLIKEAEKCILLCANCHRELHATESTEFMAKFLKESAVVGATGDTEPLKGSAP